MDWSKLAPVAGKLAEAGLPYLGQILGDLIPFPGGSIAGQLIGDWAGKAIASALGVPPTPEAVGSAINSMPASELQARLQSAESEAAAKWEAAARIAEAEAADRTAQAQAINETIREENAKGVSWWHWRHILGYVLVLFGFEMCILVPIVLTGKITAADAGQLITVMTPVLAIFAGLNGYIAQDTTKRQTVAMTGEHPPPLASGITKAVLPVKKK